MSIEAPNYFKMLIKGKFIPENTKTICTTVITNLKQICYFCMFDICMCICIYVCVVGCPLKYAHVHMKDRVRYQVREGFSANLELTD